MVGCGWDDAGGCSDVGGSWVGEAEGVGVGVGSCVGAGADASALIFASRLPVSCSDIPVVYVPCSRIR